MYVYVPCGYLVPRETVGSDGADPPCGCWGLNLDAVEEQPVLLKLTSLAPLSPFLE